MFIFEQASAATHIHHEVMALTVSGIPAFASSSLEP